MYILIVYYRKLSKNSNFPFVYLCSRYTVFYTIYKIAAV